ncbi:MAG: hypothetical protein ACE3L7_10790 [Candidatus Pristimantibacillus sp.]
MTHNKSDKKQNHSGSRERSAKLNMTKFATRPPSLNGIRKHLP